VSPPPRSVQIHNHAIQKAKDVIVKMHAHATHLMDSYSEQYLLDETYDEWGVNIRYRISTPELD
jgi:hypothetical protein